MVVMVAVSLLRSWSFHSGLFTLAVVLPRANEAQPISAATARGSFSPKSGKRATRRGGVFLRCDAGERSWHDLGCKCTGQVSPVRK